MALNAEDGSYAWHYQMVPEEDWDYTCTSSIVSADLEIEGRQLAAERRQRVWRAVFAPRPVEVGQPQGS